MKICICGGGHLGHVCAGVLASQDEIELNILSRNSSVWSNTIKIVDIYLREYYGKVNLITSNPEDAIKGADIILLCLPGYAIEETLRSIKPYLKQNQLVGSIVSSTGFFFIAHEVLGTDAKLFGFQRVPYIARLTEYGRSAELLGYKDQLKVAVENISNRNDFRKTIEKIFITPTILLNNFYEACLTNSNPILHTGRLYSMWKDWDGEIFDRNILFYKEWTDEASEIIIAMDREFNLLLDKLDVDKQNIPSLLDYYESTDISSLTIKIRSIPAFQNIPSPMKKIEGGWVPDFGSRYFTEDFPFGLKYIKDLVSENGIAAPVISTVYSWGIEKSNINIDLI